jgi:hypothetical protein
VFVPEDRLKINLPGLVEKAISKWSETQPRGFTRPVVEECGDFIATEMDSKKLRCLRHNEALFSDEATAEEFRECVFVALDHWLVQAEISGEPVPAATGAAYVSRPDPPFSEAVPPVDPYNAFNESWGPVDFRKRKARPIVKPELPAAWTEEQPVRWSTGAVLACVGLCLLILLAALVIYLR